MTDETAKPGSEKEFVRACSIEEIPTRRGKNIYFDEDRQVAIFKIEGKLYAVNNICPHQHAPVLFEGQIEDCTVTCPLHGWMYDLETGQALGGGAKLKTFEVYVEGEDVMVEVPKKEIPAWMR